MALIQICQIQEQMTIYKLITMTLTDPGAQWTRGLPRDPNFFYFMQFFGKNLDKSYVGGPLPEGWRPQPQGNPASASEWMFYMIHKVINVTTCPRVYNI